MESTASRRLYGLAAVFAVLAAAALAVDLPTAAWFAQHKLPGDLATLIRLAEVFAHGWGVACILVTVLVLDQGRRRRTLRLAASTFGAGLLSNLVKLSLGRYRPSALQCPTVWETFAGLFPWATRGWRQIGAYDLASFPSSHTAAAVGLAAGLTWLYPQGRWLFAVFAVLAALQRVQARAHYVSDTLAGAALGCLAAALCLSSRGVGRWFTRWETAQRL